MAEDPINQQQFEEDVLAAAAANNGESYADLGGMGSGFQMPNIEEVWKIIQQMDGISEAEKENLRDSLFNPEGATKEDFLKRFAAQEPMGHSNKDYMTFFAMIAILFLVFEHSFMPNQLTANYEMNNAGAKDNIVEQLRKSVQSFVDVVGADNEYAKGLIKKIQYIQEKLAALSSSEQSAFLHNMKDSFMETIEKVERKIQQYSYFEQTRNYSVLAAIIFVILLVVALFGYKLYKSLMEKEQKRQEKLKNKQTKKSKKSN